MLLVRAISERQYYPTSRPTAASIGRPSTFGSATNVEVSTATTSRKAYPRNIPAGGAITASAGASYSLDNGAFTSGAGTWGTTKQIRARITSSADYETTVTATITIDGVGYEFPVITRAADLVPDAFSFTDADDANTSTVIESDAITVAGIEAATSFTVTGGTAEKNDSGTWASSGTVENGDTVKVRGTSSASYSTAVNVVLTIGGVSDTFTITTIADPGTGEVTFDGDSVTFDGDADVTW